MPMTRMPLRACTTSIECGGIRHFRTGTGALMAIRSFLEHRPQLGDRVFIDDSAVVIGRVQLGTDVSVWPLTAIRGDVHDISIGARTNIQDGSVLHNTSPD